MTTDNNQEKIAPASQKKLQEAKKQGLTAKSYDFTNFAVLLCSVLCMTFYFYFSNDFYKLASFNFELKREALFDNIQLLEHLKLSTVFILKSLLPYFLILLVITVMASMITGGFLFSFEILKFKAERLNIFKGVGKVFSMKNLLEIFILILKVIFLIVSVIGYYLLFKNYMVTVGVGDVKSSIILSIYYILITLLFLGLLLMVISIFDIPYRKYKFNKEIEMTYEEIKEEQKNNEGRQEIKSARKRMYFNLLNKK